ncbi:MAG TPA: (d)CMP kinase [Caldisericia bacterium]|nr:MAG: Cytidylate kinase [bacterium ADurb.Bin132]HNY61300.1 (d)CMP kinase [Caldisericia bacterium]HOC78767.1 (d)CMP kinase [Caldisericia bacterium]HOG70285.1 (d)CMP kinase [Caldisericia bacterium]HPA65944.1 (d)CMP kinase [Caldisericia bacterium]
MIQHPVIAIDGPAASGKTTVGALAAKKLGIKFLDSGRLYRVAAYASTKLGKGLPEILSETNLRLEGDRFIVNGEDATEKLGSVETGELASKMSLDPRLREWVNAMVRELAAEHPIIVTGRDIGTVVLPDATLKIYLDASIEERARRRYAENPGKATCEEILEALKKRDKRDSERDIAPLVPASDAIIVDSTKMNITQVTNLIIKEARQNIKKTRITRWWRFSYSVIWFLSRKLFGIEIHGRGNIPQKGPIVVIANHTSALDVLFVGLSLTRMGVYLAKEEILKVPVLRTCLRAYGVVPVRRGQTSKDTVRAVSDTLSNGGLFCIYPEGTRSKDGKLQGNYQTGAAQFAHKFGAKILPIGVIGAYQVMPYGSKCFKRGKVIVNVGKPMSIDKTSKSSKGYYEDITEIAMKEVAQLSKQPYVPLKKSAD